MVMDDGIVILFQTVDPCLVEANEEWKELRGVFERNSSRVGHIPVFYYNVNQLNRIKIAFVEGI